MTRCATIRVFCTHADRVLVDVIAMHMMQMAIMQIVDVTVVSYCGVTAPRSVDVGMIGVLRV